MAIDCDPRGPQDMPVDEAPVENLTYDDEVRSQQKRYYWLQDLGQVCQECLQVPSLSLKRHTGRGHAFVCRLIVAWPATPVMSLFVQCIALTTSIHFIYI
jgi:hypothetical protein